MPPRIDPVEVLNVREVVVPIDQYGWWIRIDPDKDRDLDRVMYALSKWLSRWATRRGKWLVNEPRLSRSQDIRTLESRYALKWTACDAPSGIEAGRKWVLPASTKSITYRRLDA